MWCDEQSETDYKSSSYDNRYESGSQCHHSFESTPRDYSGLEIRGKEAVCPSVVVCMISQNKSQKYVSEL